MMVAWLVASRLQAADDARGIELFNQTVQPLLRKQCHACHSHESKKHSGGLVVDSRAALLAGGETGPAVVPGKPEESWLVNAVRRDENFVQMPPKSKLSEAEVAAIVEWIKLGAPWPGDTGKAATRSPGKISDEDRQWWAFQPVAEIAPPNVNDPWIRNEIDQFVFDKLRQAELTPAPEASRAVLIRRLYFDLWGLPPTPDDVAAFVKDPDPNAYERLVDRLLAGSQYGERWARHWLDLVRYADSDGYRIDDYRPAGLALSRLCDQRAECRQAVRPLRAGAIGRRRAVSRRAGGPDRHRLLAALDLRIQQPRRAGPMVDHPQRHHRYHRRRVPGAGSAMCPLPRSQVRSDLAEGLLPFAGVLRGAAAARRSGGRDRRRAGRACQQKLAAWEPKTAGLREQLAALEEPYRQKAENGAIIKFPEEIQAMIRKPVAQREPLEQQLAELAYRQVTYEFDHLDRQLKGETKEQIFALRKELAAFEKRQAARRCRW